MLEQSCCAFRAHSRIASHNGTRNSQEANVRHEEMEALHPSTRVVRPAPWQGSFRTSHRPSPTGGGTTALARPLGARVSRKAANGHPKRSIRCICCRVFYGALHETEELRPNVTGSSLESGAHRLPLKSWLCDWLGRPDGCVWTMALTRESLLAELASLVVEHDVHDHPAVLTAETQAGEMRFLNVVLLGCIRSPVC